MKRSRLTTLLLLALAVAAAAPPSAGQELALTGTLLDDAGEPLAGAEVTLHPLTSFAERGALLTAGEAYPEPVARAVTGAGGRFRVAAPEAGFWTLVARAEGRVSVELPLWPLIAPAEVEPAELLPDAGVRIRVLDEGGRPIPGAVVEAFGSGPPGDSRFREPGRWRPVSDRIGAADAQGRLRLPRFEGEEVSLRAVAPGRSAEENVGEPPARGAVRLALAPGPTRRVRVVAPDGRPAAGAVVWFDSPIPAGLTGADGTLEVPLQAAEPGEPTEVQVDSGQGLVAEAELRAPEEEEEPGEPVTLRLEPPPTVSGRVIEEGTRDGVAGAFVWLRRDPSAAVRADRTGSFRIAVRRPGDRELLQAVAPGFLEAHSRLPRPGRRESDELALVLEPAAALPGTVVDAAGRPVAGAEVRVAPAERRGPYRGGRPAFARSGRDGRFQVEGLAADASHVVHVVRRGYSPAVEEVAPAPAVPPGSARPAALPELRVVLYGARALRGRAVNQDGEPVAGARVTTLPEDVRWLPWRGAPPGRAEATTGADGAFEVAEVLAGRSTLGIAAPGYAPFRREGVEVPQGGGVTDLGELVLEPEAFVPGRVVDPEGAPVPGASVRSWRTSGTRMRRMYYPGSQELAEPVETGEDGRFRVGGAAAGEVVRIEVRKEGWVEATVEGVRVPPEEPVTVLLRPAATVAGAVVDERGRPVPGAEIRPAFRAMAGMPGGGYFRPQPTDERGAFEVTGFPPGRTAIEAEAPGYQASAPVTLELAPGERREGVEIVLAEGAAVSGRVLGPDGLPVAGARVAARGDEAFGASWRGASVETGADGRFTLDTLAPGRVVLEATKDGFAAATREVELGPGGASVELHLGRGAEVSGWVLEADGSPAAGRQLQLAPGVLSFDQRNQQTAAADGSFLFRGVADGEYRLKVLEDWSVLWSSPDPIRVEGGVPVSGLEVRLPATATLTGRLVGLRPDEIQGATVQAMVAEMGLQGERAGEVLPDGGYRVSGLTPGRWQVVAAATRSGRQAQGKVEIEAGRTEAVLDLEFRPGHTVTGTVLSAGEPVAGAQVRVQSQSYAGTGDATTGIDGRFRIEGVSAGRQRLMVQDPQSGTMAFEELQVDGDRDVRVELESFRIRGAVYAADGSGPVAGAQVQLQRAPDAERRSFAMAPSTVTADDGSFLLTGVAGGSWRLLVEKSGYGAHASDVEVPGGDVEAAPVFLERAGSLEIVARLARGGAPSFLAVTILGPGDQVIGNSRATAVEPGRFVLGTVPAGTWELLLWTPEAPPQRVEVESPGTVEVVFPEPCVLEVSVPELAATGMAAQLTLTDPAGRSPWSGFGAGQAPLDRGRLEIPSLAPGTWVVTVTAEDGGTWSATATVAPGAPTRLVLE